MIYLDTDHLTVLTDDRDKSYPQLVQKLESASEGFQLPLIVVEESIRGLFGMIHRYREVNRQLYGYSKLLHLLRLLKEIEIVPFDEPAAELVQRFQAQKIRTGVEDLKIASISISRNALLLTNNLKDFKRIPGLKVESWIA